MITLEKAIEVANDYIAEKVISTQLNLVLIQDNTIEFEYGWVFFYQTKEYIETENIIYMAVGNAPIIINRLDGSVHITGTAYPVEKYIADYVNSFK